MVELVRTDINKNLRTALGAMVVMDVHNRDTTEELASLGVRVRVSSKESRRVLVTPSKMLGCS